MGYSFLSGVHAAMDAIENVVSRIPGASRNLHAGNDNVNDLSNQFALNVMVSVASGLPGVGLPVTGATYLANEYAGSSVETDYRIALGTTAVSAGALAYFFPHTARQAGQFGMYRAMVGVGFYPTLGTAEAGIAGSGVAYRVPTWALIALVAYSGSKSELIGHPGRMIERRQRKTRKQKEFVKAKSN